MLLLEMSLLITGLPQSGKKVWKIIIPPVYEVYRGYIVIPPVYEVYRGYIVLAFSVCVCVCVFVCLCVCKLFFPSKISQELLDLGS